MEITTTRTTTQAGSAPARQAAVNGLAIVGFIALVFIGITLAIYAARYVPNAVSRIGSANVFFSILGGNKDNANLVVVPATVPIAGPSIVATSTATSTAPATTPVATTPKPTTTPTPSAGTPTSSTYVIGGTAGTPAPANYYGKSDLTVAITSVGYLDSADTSTYNVSKSVPNGKRGAFKFRITNIGTNVSGSYNFESVLPTSSSYTFSSPTQNSLRPGEYVDYVLGFDRTKSGDSREVSVTVDPDHNVSESNESNNSDSATVTIN
jgi:hypothetical protein